MELNKSDENTRNKERKKKVISCLPQCYQKHVFCCKFLLDLILDQNGKRPLNKGCNTLMSIIIMPMNVNPVNVDKRPHFFGSHRQLILKQYLSMSHPLYFIVQ